MESQSYGVQWIQHHIGGGHSPSQSQSQEEEILANGSESEYLVTDRDVNADAAEIDQIAAENLIFMASDGQMMTEIIAAGTDESGTIVVSASDGSAMDCAVVMQQAAAAAGICIDGLSIQQDDAGGGCYTEEYTDTTPQMVTEEVITDDWVQHQGEERVEISAEQIISSSSQVLLDIEVPLPTVQDEYTALRPYPCDFCSRRFRKKASLINHMVAHQNDRPHLCKLCGSRFFRRSDLINHLKAHAEAATDPEVVDADLLNFVDQEQLQQQQQQQLHQQQQQQQRHRTNDHYYDQDWNIQSSTIVISNKSSRSKNNSNSIATTGTGTATTVATTTNPTPRGRISRLKPKEENFTINESINHNHHHNLHQTTDDLHIRDVQSADIDYQQLQASTAAVKLSQDNSPAHQKSYPIIDDSKPFVCQECGLAFAREKALSSHIKNHSSDSLFECNQCNEIFWDMPSLLEHQKQTHFDESNSEYDPADCEDETQSESESDRLYGEFYCSECGMSFHRQDLLRRHSKMHLGTSADGGGGGGDAGGGEASNLMNDSKDQHCCNTCGETFAEALDLLAHAEIHARFPPFKCVLCGESFFEEQTIKRHLQAVHSSELTANSCILCGKECRDRKALIKHAWDHSREKCHSCSKCGKNFHNKARLKRHMASHRDKSVVCDVCQEEFPDGRTLSNHRHSHSTTSAGKLFPCTECGKTFGSRSSQQIHVRIHTGERPYGCRYCWKAFADGGTLRKHERIHTGEKPYACSVCPRAFNQRVVLREHIRSHHSGLDPKRGTYYCAVCSANLLSSNDLLQHLIQHSDMNTAMQRQPVTGPRKYKRRRKLKPHEIERLRREGQQDCNGSDIDISDFDMDVDDLLAITDAAAAAAATTTTSKQKNGKRNKQRKTSKADINYNNNNNITAGGINDEQNGELNDIEDNIDDDDEGDDVDRDDDDVVDRDNDEDQTIIRSKKTRYNSTNSSQSDKLWQTKLIHSNSNEENYKSLLTNLENTLQSIDTLVVGSSNMNNSNNNIESGAAISGVNFSKVDVEDRKSKQRPISSVASTAQRTQQIQIIKAETKYTPEVVATVGQSTTKSSRKSRNSKTTTKSRPRMIHTEKCHRPSNADGSGNKRRSKSFINRTETNSSSSSNKITLMPPTKSSSSAEATAIRSHSMVDDYEIISPATRPPNQISSSPLHIKQEHDQQHHHQQQQQQQQQHNQHRNGDLYDAHLLLEASTLRKAVYEKFNPSIVNDLEEILRSPIKGESRMERQRFTSESSTQFLADQSEEEENHLIKIEPTSPDLREIVVGGSGSGSTVNVAANNIIDAGNYNHQDRRSTRSMRSRTVTANRKYLEFETDDVSSENTQAHKQKRTASSLLSASSQHQRPNSYVSAANKSACKPVKTPETYSTVPATASSSVTKLSSSSSHLGYDIAANASITSVDVVAAATAAATAAASAAAEAAAAAAVMTPNLTASNATAQPDRKARYFECEMCSAVFSDRAQLLDHVPIHI